MESSCLGCMAPRYYRKLLLRYHNSYKVECGGVSILSHFQKCFYGKFANNTISYGRNNFGNNVFFSSHTM